MALQTANAVLVLQAVPASVAGSAINANSVVFDPAVIALIEAAGYPVQVIQGEPSVAGKAVLGGSSSAPTVGLTPNQCTSATLQLWLKASVGVTTDALRQTPAPLGGSVGGWTDLSGQGNHANQPVAGNQPQLVTEPFGGYPVIRFNGSSSALNHGFAGEPGTLIIVHRQDPHKTQEVSATQVGMTLMSGQTSNTGNVPAAYYAQSFSNDAGGGYGRRAYFRITTGETIAPTGANNNPWKNYAPSSPNIGMYDVYGMRNDGAFLRMYKGAKACSNPCPLTGTLQPLAAKPPALTNPIQNPLPAGLLNFTIGVSFYQGSLVSWFAGDILEIIAFTGALSIAEYNQVIAYVQAEYPNVLAPPAPTYVWPTFQGDYSTNLDENGISENLVMAQSTDGEHWVPRPINYLPRVGAGFIRDLHIIGWASNVYLCHSNWTGNSCPAGFDVAVCTDGFNFLPYVYVDLTQTPGFPNGVIVAGTNCWAPEWVRNSDGTPYLVNGHPVILANVGPGTSSFNYYLISPNDASMTAWTCLGQLTFAVSPNVTGGGIIDGMLMYDLVTGKFVLSCTDNPPPQYVNILTSSSLLGPYAQVGPGTDATGIRAATGYLDFEGTCLMRMATGQLRWYGDNRGGGYWLADNVAGAVAGGWENVRLTYTPYYRPQHGSPIQVAALGGYFAT